MQHVTIRRSLPFVLTAFLLISEARLLLESLRMPEGPDRPLEAAISWDARMQSVIAALPSDVRVVGYLEAADLDASVPRQDVAEFYLTQYALAPVVLKDGADYDWIVGNFGAELQKTELPSILDRMLVSYSLQDLGFGIYLIHRPSR